MSHMQIDFPSPSPLRPVSHKRPRSPTSPSPSDRPSKRVSLALGSVGRTPSPLLEHVPQHQQQAFPDANLQLFPPSVFQGRRTSDDWVKKTSGLKLDSPLFDLGHVGTVPLPEPGKWSSMDCAEVNTMHDAHELMNTDIHDPPRAAMKRWPFPPAAEHLAPQSPFDPANTTNAPFSSPPPLRTHPPTTTHAPTQHSDIHIHVQPATPSNRRSPHSAMIQSSPMSISPSNSGVWSPSTPSRKPRVTMGPRPDCEKCRMGVKGHWMHIE